MQEIIPCSNLVAVSHLVIGVLSSITAFIAIYYAHQKWLIEFRRKRLVRQNLEDLAREEGKREYAESGSKELGPDGP